ncbi:MAG: SulP family inorganic anion transporter [Candidatus Thermoplasmatota archaeon]|nr:SulP family inorganic anion transporter [Candidatus Thermoplasmatota archaeon]
MALLSRLFPFLAWFPMTRETLRADLVAGITVTLILVPQSMAYAQLAGLPVVYGLYAAFLPVMVASLWGSLRQLHTGPTAMLSLMSAAALIPYAGAASENFIALSVMLALMVGILRLALGLFRLGLVVNFLSHPVIIGFTNAAALIIGLSQLNKLVNVPMPRTEFFLADLWVVLQQLGGTHWPTLMFALAAFSLIFGLQKFSLRIPGILIAIVITTMASYLVGFERTSRIQLDAIQDQSLRAQIVRFGEMSQQIRANGETLARFQAELSTLEEQGEAGLYKRLEIKAQIDHRKALARMLEERVFKLRIYLHQIDLARETAADGSAVYVTAGHMPEGEPLGMGHWRFAGLEGGQVKLIGGGEVVGAIPAGLPGFQVPYVDWKLVLPLLPAALVMALLGFMEATSISKAISARTGQRTDANRELVGQGLANIVGSFFHSYVVSGSFSRSAVAAREGAKTGLFAIVSALGVMLVILFFTPLLYHLPQAVLAVIIMFAVFGLIRVKALLDAWKVNRLDAVIGIVTFLATLAMAPALANGILVGVALTVGLYLLRNMRPRAEVLGRHPDGVLGGVDTHGLPAISEHYVVMRFDGSLNFVNVAYFEEALLQALTRFPEARAILVIGNGINDVDASGEEKLRSLALQLRSKGVGLYFSSLKRQVLSVFEKGALSGAIPADHVFKTKELALRVLDWLARGWPISWAVSSIPMS